MTRDVRLLLHKQTMHPYRGGGINPPQNVPLQMHFDWVEDAVAMPIKPTLHAWDLSGLKMGCKQLFGALRRRMRWWQAPPPFFLGLQTLSHSPSSQAYGYYPQHFITWWHPSGIGPGKPTVTIPFGEVPAPTPPVPKLNWDQDPCFANFSRAFRHWDGHPLAEFSLILSIIEFLGYFIYFYLFSYFVYYLFFIFSVATRTLPFFGGGQME